MVTRRKTKTKRAGAPRATAPRRLFHKSDGSGMNADGMDYAKLVEKAMAVLARFAHENGYDRSDALRICHTNIGFAFAVEYVTAPSPKKRRTR